MLSAVLVADDTGGHPAAGCRGPGGASGADQRGCTEAICGHDHRWVGSWLACS